MKMKNSERLQKHFKFRYGVCNRYHTRMTKIKEYDIEDEEELLETIMLEPETDKNWDKGWEWVDP